MTDVRVLILAGGKGTRMGADVPKALVQINGKPFIDYILERVTQSGVDPTPAVVVGHDLDQLKAHLGTRAELVVQEEQLGTGHAVLVAHEQLQEAADVLVTYGDHPLYAAETYRKMIDHHRTSGAVITMLTTEVEDFEGWRSLFLHWGRVLRNEDGEVTAVREFKVCSDQEKAVREVNNGMYCFDGEWLWKNVSQIDNNNPKGEYYLTSLFEMALAQGKKIETISCEAEEGIGINSPEELAIAEKIVQN